MKHQTIVKGMPVFCLLFRMSIEVLTFVEYRKVLLDAVANYGCSKWYELRRSMCITDAQPTS